MVERVGIAEWSAREVHFQVPTGSAPPRGWPVVIFFQGSLVSAEESWSATAGDAFGAFHLTETYATLLGAGFAILSPETRLDGTTYWDSNVPPYAWEWKLSDDHELMMQIFEGIDQGDYGDLDSQALHAMGISSGGYMTSRMAIAYPSRFRRLAVHSASYATCSGLLCSVPDTLSSNHPPTLLLHGGQDVIVPIDTARAYADALATSGVDAAMVVDPEAGHAWLAEAPEIIEAWFTDAVDEQAR